MALREGAGLLFEDVTQRIIGAFFEVYRELPYGYLESVYRRALLIALRDAGLACRSEVALKVHFRNRCVGDFRADLIVDDKVIVEAKTAIRIHETHQSQLLNYLKISRLPVGLILNFGPTPTFKRYVLSPQPDQSA